MIRPGEAALAQAFWEVSENKPDGYIDEALVLERARQILVASGLSASLLQAPARPALPTCWCETCRPQTMTDMRFIVCPDCGNKRCPRANSHEHACTGSNDVGQPGSSWERVKPAIKPEATSQRCPACTGSVPIGLHCGGVHCPMRQEAMAPK